MPAYLGPPPHPWIPRPESAFRPANAWIPFDEGNVRDFAGGRPATRSGSTALGRGDWGPTLVYSGGTALTSALPGTLSACSITSFHRASTAGNGAIFGIGTSGQIGLLYYNGQYGINSFSGVLNNAITLAPPTDRGWAVTTTLGGFATGAPVSHWVNGVLVYTNTLTLNITNPGGSAIRLGASGNSSWPWAGSIGPTYLHDRVLNDHEVRKLHADPWRLFRDQGSRLPRTFYSIPPPWVFSGGGTGGTPSGAGALGFTWPASGAGTAGAPAGAGVLATTWEFAGAGTAGDPSGSGTLETTWEFAGAGAAGEPEGAGTLDWVPPPWVISGAGVMAAPEGSGTFVDLRPTGPCGGSLFLWMDLIQRIAVRRPTLGQDAVGGVTKDWVVIRFDLPASIHPLSGTERRAIQQADGTTVTHRVYLDPCDVVPLKSTDQLEYQGRIFEIVTPMVTAETGELYAVDCRELIP